MAEQMTTYEYGAMSSRFSLQASNKLTAYAAMVYHYDRSAFALVIYEPEEAKEDSWTSFDGKIAARLDELFGGEGAFDKYVEEHIDEVKACMDTIKRLV